MKGYVTTPLLLTQLALRIYVTGSLYLQHLLCCNQGIFFVVADTADSRVSILHVVSGILAVPQSPTSVGTVMTASRRYSAELPHVLKYLFL